MNELNTPFSIGKAFSSDDGVKVASINDANGFYVIDCFKVDADEIIKRINGYADLEQQLEDVKDKSQRVLEDAILYHAPEDKEKIERLEQQIEEANKVCEELANTIDVNGLQLDELRASNTRLHSVLNQITETAKQVDGWESFPSEDIDIAVDALEETPKQALAEIKAQAVEDAAKKVFAGRYVESQTVDFLDIANSLRNNESEDGS